MALLASAEAAERRPNFLIILGDNLGKDWFGCYGADGGHTPHIDALAADGVRFEHCYVTAAVQHDPSPAPDGPLRLSHRLAHAP